jgi:hypothetical protein
VTVVLDANVNLMHVNSGFLDRNIAKIAVK